MKSYAVLLDDDSHELWEVISNHGETVTLRKEKNGPTIWVPVSEVWIII